MNIKILKMQDHCPDGYKDVNCTSRSKDWGYGLSPFFLGPIPLYGGRTSLNMENAWQYAKLYKNYADENDNPTAEYWKWAERGWANGIAQRYPMGKGSKPLCSLWDGKKLGYNEARRAIYAPLYAAAVAKTDAFSLLKKACESGSVAIRDFDGYDHDALGMSLDQVMVCESRKMGHVFVLKMLLLGRTDLLTVPETVEGVK